MNEQSAALHAEREAQALPRTVVLRVEGMNCAACSARVEKVVAGCAGVQAVAVNLPLDQATIELEGNGAELAAVTSAIERAGYRASLIADGTGSEPVSPEQDSARAAENERSDRLGRIAFVVAAVATVAIALPMVLSMLGVWPALTALLAAPSVQFSLSLLVQVLLGSGFYLDAYRSLRGGGANMSVLVALGTSVAFVYSTVSLFAFHGGLGLHFESSAMLLTLVRLGKLIEGHARRKTTLAIRSLLALRPPSARVLRDGAVVEIPADRVRLGEHVLVPPGGAVAVDGVIVEGTGVLEEAMLTGESEPVLKQPGDVVFAGTINGNAALRVRTTGVGVATRLARIVAVVRQALGTRAPVQQLADRVSAVFVPVVVAIALATFLGWYLIGGDLTRAVINAVSALVIACPCALGLATPTALVAGLGLAAKHGVLVRSGDALERLSKLGVAVFDKTGTLTTGHPELVELITSDGAEGSQGRATEQAAAADGAPTLLDGLATLESRSEHPVGRALGQGAVARGGRLLAATNVQAHPGRGVAGEVDGVSVAVGTRAFLEDRGVATAPFASGWETLEQRGLTVAGVAIDGRIRGLAATSDTLRQEARAVVQALCGLGVRSVVLSGDNPRAVARVAEHLGIAPADVFASVAPEDKATVVQTLRAAAQNQRRRCTVAMIGDGINDAPALAAADVGIAVGDGTDVALETADVALTRHGLLALESAVLIARHTMRKVRQNLFLAFVYNVVGIPLAAFGLLNPMIAGAAMALSSVSVVTNAALLRRYRPRKAAGNADALQPN